MSGFIRSFFLSLSVIVLVFVLVFGFELTNRNIENSGFSSGEVFDFSLSESAFSGEILGRKFSFDIIPAPVIMKYIRPATFFLPPFIRAFFLLSEKYFSAGG